MLIREASEGNFDTTGGASGCFDRRRAGQRSDGVPVDALFGQQVQQSHTQRLSDDWACVLLDGVWLRVRRAGGPQKVLLLVTYGVQADGSRWRLAFLRAKSESQAAWKGLLNDLRQRGLASRKLEMILTDGWAGLAAGRSGKISHSNF
jgi:transposase-like protein